LPRLTSEAIIEARKNSTSPITFLRIPNIPHVDGSGSTSIYFCDADEPLSFFDESGNPEAYLPVGIHFESIHQDNSNKMVNFRVRIDNVSRDLCALVALARLDGTQVEILRGYRNLLDDPSYAQPLIRGVIQSFHVDEYEVQLDVTSPVALSQKVPRRLCWSRCQWKFKGPLCRAHEVNGFLMRAWKKTSTTYKDITPNDTPTVRTTVPMIDFTNMTVGGSATYYNMRFEGRIVPKYTETLTLKVTSDDGVRLYVNGSLKIDKWVNQSATFTTTVSATSGVPLSIQLDHYNRDGNERIRLAWSSASLPEEVVGSTPGSVLLPESIASARESATTCGRTLDDCKALDNQRYFGGFPYIEKSRDPRQLWTIE